MLVFLGALLIGMIGGECYGAGRYYCPVHSVFYSELGAHGGRLCEKKILQRNVSATRVVYANKATKIAPTGPSFLEKLYYAFLRKGDAVDVRIDSWQSYYRSPRYYKAFSRESTTKDKWLGWSDRERNLRRGYGSSSYQRLYRRHR